MFFIGMKNVKVLFNILMSLFPTGCFLSSNQILASSLLYKLWVKGPVVENVKEESSKFILGNNHALAEPDTSPRQTRLIFSTWTLWTVDPLLLSLDQNHHITLKSNFKSLVIHLFQGFEVFSYNWTFSEMFTFHLW